MTDAVFVALGEDMLLRKASLPEGVVFRGRMWPCSLEGQGTGRLPLRPGVVPVKTYRLLAVCEAMAEDDTSMEVVYQGRQFSVLRAEAVRWQGSVCYWACLLREQGGG